MAHGAVVDSGTPVILTPMLTERLTPAALTPKPVSGEGAAMDAAVAAAAASSALIPAPANVCMGLDADVW